MRTSKKDNVPQYSFNNDTNTGVGSEADDTLDLTAGGDKHIVVKKAASADSAATNNAVEIAMSSPADTTGTNTHNALNIDLDIGNATGGTNTVRAIAIDNISGDASVTEEAINIGTGFDRGIVLNDSAQNMFLPTVASATIDYTDSSTALFTVPAGETWIVHDILVNITTNFDATGDDATYVIGDGDDPNGFVDLVDAELQTADTEITGGQAGWQGQLSGTKGAYLADGSFVVVGAETIDGTCGGTSPAAGAGTAWIIYTRIA